MKRRYVIAMLCVVATSASAQQAMTRWTVDGGGGHSQSGRYAITGTVGQPDAVPLLRSSRYTLGGGFWTDVAPGIFGDGFEGD